MCISLPPGLFGHSKIVCPPEEGWSKAEYSRTLKNGSFSHSAADRILRGLSFDIHSETPVEPLEVKLM